MTREDEDIRLLLTSAVPPLTPPPDRVVKVGRRVRRHRQRLIGSAALAVAVVVGLGVGGAQILNRVPSPHTAADSAGQGQWTSCVEAAPEMVTRGFAVPTEEAAALPRLGDDFVPAAAVICGLEPPVGKDVMVTERRSDDVAALAALTAVLRLPDAPTNPDLACRADLQMAPWLALVDAEGRWIRPGIPLASCHNHLPDAVSEALDALPLTTVATRPLAEIESARPDMAGCGQRWVDMAEVGTMADHDARPGTLRSPFLAGQTVRLCVYDVPRSDQENGKAAGVLAHGTVLRGDRRAAVEHALGASDPANPCNASASRFAVLRPMTGSDPRAYVELDGCRRITVVAAGHRRVIAQGDAALIELIDKP
ncbi:hypothetical protein GAR06_04769 [Micromonospora saelicesensis]|uniref:hypothetical protein n=1 Tax=Micromonospora saelicesensis TaxID=285676 RepID=UPI000DC3C334|nr:hypothetical protein [Micromonospora saelicesensis]RAO43633.1 hypothetical protein GAR06_04769 [Micromonospora saelicesensis]